MIRVNIYSRVEKYLCTKRFQNTEKAEKFVKYICPRIYPKEWNFYYRIELY